MRLLPRTALSIGLLAALTLTGNAQEDAPAAAPAPEPAADEAAAEEEDVPPTPPPGPVTGVAEWEESEGVLIRWRNSDLIKKVQGDNKVYIPVSSDEDQERHLEWLTKEEVSMDNVEFIRVPVRSIYTRDYGPWFVFDGNGEPAVVDYTSGHSDRDEVFPKVFAELFGIDYYDSELHHVGGNYLPNGYGMAFSSTHLFEQNEDATEAEVLDKMEHFFGITNYPLIAPKSIWHHDTWGKPCAPDTLIVVEFPEDDVYGFARSNDTVDFYETLMTPWGTPYTIHRLPMFDKERKSRGGWGGGSDHEPSVFDMPYSPWWVQRWLDEREAKKEEAEKKKAEKAAERAAEGKPPVEEEEEPEDEEWFYEDDLDWGVERSWGRTYRPYMNSLISNGRVYVPVDDCEDDAVALAVFEKAFPGYEVVGVDSGGTFSYDSLHCRTRNFFAREPVRIFPFPPSDTEDTENAYPVVAEVIAPNGAALLEGFPVLHWSTTGEAPFEAIVMTVTDVPGRYQAQLPAQEHGTELSYYIEAKDDAGRSKVYPPVAPKGLLSLRVREDERAPTLSRFEPQRMAAATSWPPTVRLVAKDDMTTPTAMLEYAINGEDQEPIALEREPHTYWFGGQLAGEVKPGDLVTYRVVASDGAERENQASLPRVVKVYMPVAEKAAVGVIDLAARTGSGEFIAQSLGELEVAYQSYSTWPTDWDAHEVWFISLGIFPDNHALSVKQVADLAVAIAEGKAVYLEGGEAWCDDEQRDALGPLFGVERGRKKDRGFEELVGDPRSIVNGLELPYVGENLFNDTIGAVHPAEVLWSSHKWKRGRAVIQESETRRTIASTFSLAGLEDAKWPHSKKEVLVRYLEFLTGDSVQLRTAGTASPGDTVAVRIEGEPGDRYVLMASRAGYHAELPGYGITRLDPAHSFHLDEGRIGRSGVVRHSLEVPKDKDWKNVEIHVQALVGKELAPGKATFTNRDILRLTKN